MWEPDDRAETNRELKAPKSYALLKKKQVLGQWMQWNDLEDLGGGPLQANYRLVNFDSPDPRNTPAMSSGNSSSYIKIPEDGLYDIEFQFNANTKIGAFKKPQAYLIRKKSGEFPQAFGINYRNITIHPDFGSLEASKTILGEHLEKDDQIGLGLLKVDDVEYASDYFLLKVLQR